MTTARHTRSLLALALAPWLGVAQGQSHDFFLTGVFGGPTVGYVAIVEETDGSYLRLREGDRFRDGQVVKIDRQWIRIRTAASGEERVVWLKGSPPEPTSPPVQSGGGDALAAAQGQAVVVGAEAGDAPPRTTGGSGAGGGAAVAGLEEPPEDEHPHGRPLPEGRTLKDVADQLHKLQDVPQAGQSVESLSSVINPLLGLPASARIVELQSAPPRSFQSGVQAVARAANANQVIRMTIEGEGGRQRVMVFPGKDGARVATFPQQ